jgi:hypothetical protein
MTALVFPLASLRTVCSDRLIVEFGWRTVWPVPERKGVLIAVEGKKERNLVNVRAEILPQRQQSLIGIAGK